MSKQVGQWIEAKNAGDIEARLDRMLSSPDRPALAWIGTKGSGSRTVQAKGRDGQRAEIEWEFQGFSAMLEDLAEQWGAGEDAQKSTGPSGQEPDADEIYARRREQARAAAGTGQQQAAAVDADTAHCADRLPDPDDVYSRRKCNG